MSNGPAARHWLGGHLDRLRKLLVRMESKEVQLLQRAPKVWRFQLDPKEIGERERWFAEDLDESGWARVEIERTWESQGYDYDGFAWYRTPLAVQKELAGKQLSLYFGGVDGECWIYWNGELIGHHKGWDESFQVALKSDAIRFDRPNLLAVRVWDGGGQGGIYGVVGLVSR